MKTLIVYATKYGSTKTCAEKIKNQLKNDVDLVDIKKQKNPEINDYTTIIIGGSMYAGRIQKQIKKFCTANINNLLQKKIGLYICCMYEGNQAEQQFKEAFPESLQQHAAARGILGGALNFNKMNFLEKTIIKKISGVEKSLSSISEEKISSFINDLQKK